MCTKSNLGSLYCCDDPVTCPSGSLCQSSSGMYDQCMGGMGGTGGSGGMAGSCTTACDCPTGQACMQNKCVQSNLGNLYCCDDPGQCPSGGFCQSSSGQYGQCGGGRPDFGRPTDMTFGPTDGGTNFCQFIPCQSNRRCQQAGCGSCDSGGHCAE